MRGFYCSLTVVHSGRGRARTLLEIFGKWSFLFTDVSELVPLALPGYWAQCLALPRACGEGLLKGEASAEEAEGRYRVRGWESPVIDPVMPEIIRCFLIEKIYPQVSQWILETTMQGLALLILFLFYRWGNWAPERFTDLFIASE